MMTFLIFHVFDIFNTFRTDSLFLLFYGILLLDLRKLW